MQSLNFNPNVKNKRRRRRGLTLVVVTMMLMAVAGTWYVTSDNEPPLASGAGSRLELAALSSLPEWVQQAAAEHIDGPDYQYVAAIVDLNRDRQAEIVLAPAAPSQDLFIPQHPLLVLQRQSSDWQVISATVSCRPTELGSFATNGLWDIRCRNAQGKFLLRYGADGHYQPSDRGPWAQAATG